MRAGRRFIAAAVLGIGAMPYVESGFSPISAIRLKADPMRLTVESAISYVGSAISYVGSGFSRIAAMPLKAPDRAASPVIVVETVKGTFAFQTFPVEAPKTVAHITALARRGFYDGQRVHRAVRGFVVQFGDPQTKDVTRRDVWGLGAAASSGTPVGIAEITALRTHSAGAVGLAHMGEPAQGDSQIYITIAPRHDLDGKYSVFGQVIEGGQVPAALQVGDEITRVYVRP
jgi:peptidyl-prolyl cis-trans isomerase B (cyclophilin B)